MGARRDQFTDKVIIFDTSSLDPTSTTFLSGKFRLIQTFDVAFVRKGDQDICFFNQVLIFKRKDFSDHQLSSASIAKLAFDFFQFFLDDGRHTFWFRQNISQISNQGNQIIVFTLDLVSFQTGQTTKTHVQNGLALTFRELEFSHQFSLCFSVCPAIADDPDHFIDVIQGNEQTF